ncbi:hypothetical protein LEP1GSC060_3809 [Leptospira weilii serovar Ranarum str. ICFT]|uniref:Uncharacterized protein n=1 Tax=Leptospira weilii serovar Ranarum str. ICFT TaxID=1218598 RepID=N1WHS5_9LEPT|nr:hypothetical protein [Leptospira weilii]EMY78465.1 hypothetical protein LEP1GSC060_3809 [Leptospira weilii serovar Ranarum str. ICFT]
MKNNIHVFVYSWILMLYSGLNAEPVEFLAPERTLVAEKIRYELKWETGEVKDVQFPEAGIHFLEDSPDIPRFEVLYSEKKENSLVVDFVFYVTGEHPVPISWTDANGKKEFSKKRVLIESSISDSDTGPADIVPPLTFSGSYLGRLFVFTIIAGLLFVFGIYAYRIYAGKNSPLDAIIQTEPTLERMEIYEIRLNELLKRDPIPARDFARLLSGYIREKSANLSGRKTSAFTEAELFRFLYDQFPFEERELEFWREFLTEKKFRPENGYLSKKEAEEKFLHWKGIWDKK